MKSYLQLWARAEKNLQRLQMEVIWKHLDDTVHQIKLGNLVLAVDNLNHTTKQGLVIALHLGDILKTGQMLNSNIPAKTMRETRELTHFLGGHIPLH